MGAHDGYRYAKRRGYRGWRRAACIAGGAALGAINPFKIRKAGRLAKAGYNAYKRYKGSRAARRGAIKLLHKSSRFKRLKSNAHRYRGKHYTPKRPNKKLKSVKVSKHKKSKTVSSPAKKSSKNKKRVRNKVITDKRARYPNFEQNISHVEFEKKMMKRGYQKNEKTENGVKIITFIKDNKNVTLRNRSKSYDGWSVDYSTIISKKKKELIKIRLKP